MFDFIAVVIGILIFINSIRNSRNEKKEEDKSWLDKLNEKIASQLEEEQSNNSSDNLFKTNNENGDKTWLGKLNEKISNQLNEENTNEKPLTNPIETNNKNLYTSDDNDFNFEETEEYKEYMELLYESDSLFDYERDNEVSIINSPVSKRKTKKIPLNLRDGIIYKEIIDKPKALKYKK